MTDLVIVLSFLFKFFSDNVSLAHLIKTIAPKKK